MKTELIAKLDAIIEWTLTDGRLKSLDHRVPKRLAEEALKILEGSSMNINGHVTRISMDASTYDEICVNCGATDGLFSMGGLARPCPNPPAKTSETDLTSQPESHDPDPA